MTSNSILNFLTASLDHDLTKASQQVIQQGHERGRQESYKQALVVLLQSFEDQLVEVVAHALNLHDGQRKKLRYKKDRIRILRQYDIDYLKIDGVETANILVLIVQSILHEDALVTQDLNDTFPFWKEGFAMVQLDNVYKILAEDIQLHRNALIEALINRVK